MDQLDTLIKLIESKNNISLPKEKVQLIFQYLTFCKRDKNEILSRVGDIDNHFYIIMDGIIRFYYIDMNGNEITRFFAESGCILSGSPEIIPYTVETLVPTEFFVGDWDVIKSIIDNDIYWLKLWNYFLQEGIQCKIYRESCFLMKSATERYLDFKKRYPYLEKNVNQSYIASYLGITPVSLSRIRRTIK